MPYRPQTDREAIIELAQTLIERNGVEKLSLALVASTLGIKAPSLYRHVASKDALIQGVNARTFQHLFHSYEAALQDTRQNSQEQLRAILRTHRQFAHRYPRTYMLAFTTTTPAQRPDPQLLEQMALGVQGIMATLTGPEDALPALRGALALVHGFVMLELNEQFQRGGNLSAAFETAVAAYLAGIQSSHNTVEDRRS